MVTEQLKEVQDKAYSKHLFNIGMDIGKIKKLVPDEVKLTLAICQERVKKITFDVISEKLNVKKTKVFRLSCNCVKYGYRV